MNTVSFVSQILMQVQLRLLATSDGLTREQTLWRSAPHANNIGFILWHMARNEDDLTSHLCGNSRLYGWQRAGTKDSTSLWTLPTPGDRMGLRALSIPPLHILVGYLKAAHQQTHEFLSTLTPTLLTSHLTRRNRSERLPCC